MNRRISLRDFYRLSARNPLPFLNARNALRGLDEPDISEVANIKDEHERLILLKQLVDRAIKRSVVMVGEPAEGGEHEDA